MVCDRVLPWGHGCGKRLGMKRMLGMVVGMLIPG